METSKNAVKDDFGLDEEDNTLENDKQVDERLKKQSSYTYWVQKNVD